MESFIEWLNQQQKDQGLTDAELARRANVDTAVISNIKNGKRSIGVSVANAISKALKLPPEAVFRAAGLLPPALKPRDVTDQELLNLFYMLPEAQQDEVLEFVRYKLSQQEKKGTDESRATKANAPGGISRRSSKSVLP